MTEAGLVAIGGSMGLWGAYSQSGCVGVQLGLSAAVFAQFNLDMPAHDLLNADYVIAIPVTARHGPVSARLRVFHESSHLGDQFVLSDPGVRRIDLSHEAIDLLVSYEHAFARVYAGGGYIFHAQVPLARFLTQWGVELRGPPLPIHVWNEPTIRPIVGVDMSALGQRAWQVSTTLVAGFVLGGEQQRRRLRVVAAYQHGVWPFGQFLFTGVVDGIGLQVQFEL